MVEKWPSKNEIKMLKYSTELIWIEQEEPEEHHEDRDFYLSWSLMNPNCLKDAWTRYVLSNYSMM